MKIVVGFVRSREGEAAMEAAVAEAKLRGGTLIVVHSMRGGTRDEAEQAVAYREALEEVAARLDSDGVTYDIRELVRGMSPSEDVIDVAGEEQADLIVIGIRRRSPVGKLVLGSNAQDIILRAECPVLAVKASRS